MKRKMLFFERLMYGDGRTPIHCALTARIRGTLDETRLRAAIDEVQAKHPLLRTRVVEESGTPYFVDDGTVPPIAIRIAERAGDEDWRALTVAEWQLPFDLTTGPLVRLVWLRAESVSDLTMVAHHCICDGVSLVTLLRELLQVADAPATELTPYTSYATLADLVPAEVLADRKMQARIDRKAAMFRLFLAVLGRRKTTLPVGQPYLLYWTQEPAAFAAFHARCLAEGTNAHATLCVAFLRAFRDVQGKAARNKIMCPVSIRRFVRSIKGDTLFAFAPTIQLSLNKEPHAGLWDQSRTMKQQMERRIAAMKVYEDLLLGDRMQASASRIVNFLRSSRGGHDLAYSNVGRIKIPTVYTEFQLECVLGGSVSVPWRNTNTLIMSHYRNELDMSFISNERFLPQRQAEAIRDRVLELVREAMEQ